MEAYATTARIGADGSVQLSFPSAWANRMVDVVIHPARRSPEEWAAEWDRLCSEIQSNPEVEGITDEDIQAEIDAYRAGR